MCIIEMAQNVESCSLMSTIRVAASYKPCFMVVGGRAIYFSSGVPLHTTKMDTDHLSNFTLVHVTT